MQYASAGTFSSILISSDGLKSGYGSSWYEATMACRPIVISVVAPVVVVVIVHCGSSTGGTPWSAVPQVLWCSTCSVFAPSRPKTCSMPATSCHTVADLNPSPVTCEASHSPGSGQYPYHRLPLVAR